MGFMDELRRLARPYEDEEVEEFDDFEPVYRSERSTYSNAPSAVQSRPLPPWAIPVRCSPATVSAVNGANGGAIKWSTFTLPHSSRWCW